MGYISEDGQPRPQFKLNTEVRVTHGDLDLEAAKRLRVSCELNRVAQKTISAKTQMVEALALVLINNGADPLDYEVVVVRHEDGLGYTTFIRPRTFEETTR